MNFYIVDFPKSTIPIRLPRSAYLLNKCRIPFQFTILMRTLWKKYSSRKLCSYRVEVLLIHFLANIKL